MAAAVLHSLAHPSELMALVSFAIHTAKKKGGYFSKDSSLGRKSHNIDRTDTRTECYHFLNLTSRSFAAVVQALDEELRDPICIFYLVLRGLDTVEDDMTIPLDVKLPLLNAFHEKLYEKGWQFHGNSEKEKDRELLTNFDVVIDQFLSLKPAYQQVIAEICQKMGKGMADFAEIKKIDSKKDWDLYCHYVAGLVGIGLCRMFAASGLEDPAIANVEHLANSMGLFLQKVNIIRDYLEDLVDGRTFWPGEIWSRYVPQLADLRKEEYTERSLHCLNHLIYDTLSLIPDCIQFMSMLRNDSVFQFCAIPQVMAIATLALCFNNHKVFERNVKIRKGLALKLIMNSNSIDQVTQTFLKFTRDIASRIPATDPHALELGVVIGKVDAWCQKALKAQIKQ